MGVQWLLITSVFLFGAVEMGRGSALALLTPFAAIASPVFSALVSLVTVPYWLLHALFNCLTIVARQRTGAAPVTRAFGAATGAAWAAVCVALAFNVTFTKIDRSKPLDLALEVASVVIAMALGAAVGASFAARAREVV